MITSSRTGRNARRHRPKLAAAVILSLAVAACGSDDDAAPDSADTESAAPESAAPDSAAPESAATDSTNEGSAPGDSAGPESTVPNSAGEGSAATSAFDLLPEDVQESGALKLASAFDYAPHAFTNEAGDLDGIDYDIGSALAGPLGVEVQWVQLPAFNTLIPGVQAGRADAAIEIFSVIEERLEGVQFATYMAGDQAIIVQRGNPEGIDTDNLCGARLSSDAGSANYVLLEGISEQCEANGEEPITIDLFPTPEAQQLAVETGRVDGYTGGLASGAFLAEQTGTLEVAGEVLEGRGIAGIAAARDERGDAVAAALSAAVQTIIDDGTMQEILDEWGAGASVIDTSMVVKTPEELAEMRATYGLD